MKLTEVQIFPKAKRHPSAQRQDSLTDQLKDLIILATKNGMYDAADFLQNQVLNMQGDGTWSSTFDKRGIKRRVWIPGKEEDTQLLDNGPKNS